MQLGFTKARHKITPGGKHGRGLQLGKLSTIRRSRLIFLQQPCCPLTKLSHFLIATSQLLLQAKDRPWHGAEGDDVQTLYGHNAVVY